MSANAAVAKPGCGCGGSVAGCGCGGACGSGPVPANLTATAFVRPRFFAGQLLTEDDLSALAAYTAAKDRMHNRYLFGAGVVCGLWVSCDPCGGGTVVVQPGYALDCCGNDLLLPCAATLDVNAMIRDLRATQLRKDCGDPCASQGTGSSGQQNATPSRRYCLYARYGEQLTDPVAPYATGDPCGQVACEPTRIREGISFVLKCPVDAPPPDDLWARICACVPSQDVLDQEARLKAYSGPMTSAAGAAEHPPAFSVKDAEELTNVRAGLAKERAGTDEQRIRSATEEVRRLAALIAGYYLARDRTEYDEMAAARSELGQAAAALAEEPAVARYAPPDQPAVSALLEHAAQLADRPESLPRVRLAMLAQGWPFDDPVLAALASDAAGLLEWLLDRLDNDPTLADCELRSRAKALSLPTAAESETHRIRSLGRAASELVDLVAGVVRDCICAALDPPCAPCEDTDVLLACLEVCDCTVVRICNAERDYVISGSALRYWLPTGPLHEWLASFCCRPDCSRDAARAEPSRFAFYGTGSRAGEHVPATAWDLLDLPNPVHMMTDVMERVGAARAAPTAPQPPAAARAADADATARQVAALADRVAALTEQLTQSQARLDQTEAKLDETEAKLDQSQARLDQTEAMLGGIQTDLRKTKDDLGKAEADSSVPGSQPQPTPAPPRRAPTPRAPTPRAPTRPRRPAAGRSTAASLPPAEGPGSDDQAGVGETVSGSDVAETSHDSSQPTPAPPRRAPTRPRRPAAGRSTAASLPPAEGPGNDDQAGVGETVSGSDVAETSHDT